MYRARPIRFLRRWVYVEWRLKVYGITASRDRPPNALVAAAEALAAVTLPSPATSGGRHGVGFLAAHDGAHADFAFVSWWANVYELHHVLFRGPKGRPSELAPVEPSLVGCTWDLWLIAFERDAWIRSMIGTPDGLPEIATYLDTTLDAEV
jgi:hypothetical protein